MFRIGPVFPLHGCIRVHDDDEEMKINWLRVEHWHLYIHNIADKEELIMMVF